MKDILYNASFWLLGLVAIGLPGCEEFVKIDPPKNELATPTVFSSDVAAESAVRGIYSSLAGENILNGGSSSISALGGIMSDNFHSSYSFYDPFFTNAILPEDGVTTSGWNGLYNCVYQANTILAALGHAESLSESVARQLEGEARFLRALCYFYLVNLWGDVPLILTNDYRRNLSVSRTSSALVFEQIIQDLTQAKTLLPDGYSIGIGHRTRATRWAAAALLARVYLFSNEWEKAETEATSIIENVTLYQLQEDLDNVFLKNNSEAILQFYPTLQLPYNTREASTFLPSPPYILIPGVVMNAEFIAAFEENDRRAAKWINQTTVSGTTYNYVFKYKLNIGHGSLEYKEYSVVLRLAEQYLIRAEARAEQGNLTGPNSATSDLNVIRNRAGLPNTQATTRSDVINAIIHERRVELFGECGHRWFDITRTNRANILLASKPDWQTTDVLWPIPRREMDSNPKMTQNPGY